ncbi:DUF4979 domain-containing protein [Terrimonas alba]|uniref:DUF4979 domain-containing protein n=1 Tax=Terrimonas alba TaxID=3349636 RepID=UPI0035F4BA28
MQISFYLLLILVSLLCQKTVLAQDGLINDNFSTGNNFNWTTATSGATGQVVNGQFVITAALQSSGKYRGDFQKTGGTTLHAGNYPIVAIKINKPPRCNWFFDTNLGSYNNSNNNSTKIVTDSGNVYYWDLSTGKLGSTVLSLTQPTTVSLFQFKIADIVFSSAELAAGDYSYEIDWVKTFSSVDELRAFVNPSGTSNPVFEYNGAFAHPGLLHTNADLTRIKDLVTRQVSRPYKSYQLLLASSRSSFNYTKAGPFKYLTRDASLTIETPSGTAAGGTVKNGVESDFLAAYYNALMWNITGNEAHALKAIEILDAYSAYTVGIIGADAELNGLYGFMLANAAELMRHTYPSWAQDKVLQCENMLKNVFYPTLQNFRPCAHGNWDIICMKALMAIAVFSNDNAMFNKVVNYFYYGEGNGSIKNYVLTDAGQLQESNRDQPHTMLAIGSMAELAEVALKQGFDLYSANNNAIMRGYEYTAKYNLGYDVPYQTSYDYCEKNYQDYTPESISSNGRGNFRAVFEIGYSHYVYRRSKAMPYTLEALATVIGPEGAPFGADNPGYGSLFFYLNPDSNYVFAGGSNGNNSAGLINDNFNGYADGWIAATSGAVATIGSQEITITMKKQTNGTYRGDFKRSAGAVLHAGNYPILAIKMKKPPVVNLTFDTNLGAYGNGANKWTGKVSSDIYYYDLTKGFGSAPNFLSTAGQTSLSTFQFKVADVPAGGDTTYTVDWVKTFKSLNDVLAFDPNTGLINDNFSSGTDGWLAATSGSSAVAENGQLRITLAQQSSGSYRGDIKRTAGATLYAGNYPIVAVKLKKPAVVNLTFDTNLGSFGNGSNKYTGKVGENIFYFDLTKTGFGSGNTLLTNPTALTLFQFKVADITSGELSYQVDWVKTAKTVDELQSFVVPMYQTITFPAIAEKKVGDEDFSPATASSGLPVTYSTSDTSVAKIINGVIHIVGAGTTEITASQPGDNSYYAADAVKRMLTAFLPPVVKAKNIQIAVDENGNASISPEQLDSGSVSFNGALTLSIDKSAFRCSDIGTPVTVTLTGTDEKGYVNTATATVTVIDDKKPVLVLLSEQFFCYNATGSYPVPALQATDNCAIASVSYAISGATTRSGSGTDASGLFNAGQSVITWTVTDVHSNVETVTTNVTVNAPLTASIPDIYAMNPEVDLKNTLYLGYGPSSLDLHAMANGGTEPYTYQWSSGATTSSLLVSSAGTYSVTVTDQKGCVQTTSITIQLLDVRCGNGSDKVMICHNSKTICIASADVQDHLNHGDYLGTCNAIASRSANTNTAVASVEPINEGTIVYPNPVADRLTIKVDRLQEGALVNVYNVNGAVVASARLTNATQSLPVQTLAAGIYYVQVINGSVITTEKIVKQ